MSQVKYIRLEPEEIRIVQEIAERHASTMAAAIRFAIRDWKRLSTTLSQEEAERFLRNAKDTTDANPIPPT